MRSLTKMERRVLKSMGLGARRVPTLEEVRDARSLAEHQLAWLRAAEYRLLAGATSPFEARSEAEEAEHG